MRTVLCCVVYDSCVQRYTHTYEQFLMMSVGLGLRLVFRVFFLFSFAYFVLVLFSFYGRPM